MSINVASEAAQNAVQGAGDDIFSGIQLPGEPTIVTPSAANTAPDTNSVPAGEQDFSIQAFSEAPETDFVGARLAQDDPSLINSDPNTPPNPIQTANPQSSQTATTPAPGQQEQFIGVLQQLIAQNQQLIQDRQAPPPNKVPEKTQAEILSEQIEAMVKKEFPDDDGTVGKFAKLLIGQVQSIREADQQALEGRINASKQAQLEKSIAAEANEVAASILSQGYTFKNPQSQQKFSDYIKDFSLVLTSLHGGSPKQYLPDIQNVINEGVYARATFLGQRAKNNAAGHSPAPKALGITPSAPPNNPQAGVSMNAPISNWEIRQAGYATNAEAVFDDFKKVYDMRRRG